MDKNEAVAYVLGKVDLPEEVAKALKEKSISISFLKTGLDAAMTAEGDYWAGVRDALRWAIWCCDQREGLKCEGPNEKKFLRIYWTNNCNEKEYVTDWMPENEAYDWLATKCIDEHNEDINYFKNYHYEEKFVRESDVMMVNCDKVKTVDGNGNNI